MKKIILSLMLLVSLTISLNLSTTFAASYEGGIWIDGKLHTPMQDFLKMNSREKSALLMKKGAYLSLEGVGVVQASNILMMNDANLNNSIMTEKEFENLLNGNTGGTDKDFEVEDIS